jgi:outer membrane lipoprotein SlyB
LQQIHAVRTYAVDRFGVITDVQTLDQSTPGTSAGATLGGAVASAAYIDRSLRGNSYSAGANLAVGLIGAMLGSAADSAPIQQYKTRYTVRLADGEVQYFDEVKSDAFRHSSGVCIHVPEITLATQNLCNQTVESVRKRYLTQR